MRLTFVVVLLNTLFPSFEVRVWIQTISGMMLTGSHMKILMLAPIQPLPHRKKAIRTHDLGTVQSGVRFQKAQSSIRLPKRSIG